MGFTFKVTESKFTPLPEKPWYPARLLWVEEEVMTFNDKPQPKFKFYFAILDPEDYEGRLVNGMVNQPQNRDLNEKHFLYQWITTLLDGRAPSVGDEIPFPEGFFGKIVAIKLKTTTKDYGKGPMTFQNVEKIAICPPEDVALYKDRASDCVVGPPKKKDGDEKPKPQSPDPEPPKEGPEVPKAETPATTAAAATGGVDQTADGMITDPDTVPPKEAPAQEKTQGSSTVMVDGEEEEIPF